MLVNLLYVLNTNEFRRTLCISASPAVGLLEVRKAGLTFSAAAQMMSPALRTGGYCFGDSKVVLQDTPARILNAPDGGIRFGIAELVA